MLFTSILIYLLLFITYIENAKILAVFPVPSYSHSILGRSLLKGLAERGHQITMVSPFPLETAVANYEDIFLDKVVKYYEGAIQVFLKAENENFIEKFRLIVNAKLIVNELCLEQSAVKNLLRSNRTFDLVVMDWMATEVMLGFGHHYRAPVIAMSAVGSHVVTNKITANPAPYSYVPNFLTLSTDKMNFFQRIFNTISTVLLILANDIFLDSQQKETLRKYFPDAPPLQQLIQNISLVFLNSHYSFESPRPFVPNMIQIAGIHIGEPNPLEGELKNFMDNALEGVLYFSLGGNVKSSNLSKDKIDAIISTFLKLPLKVLWKFETDITMLPPNVKASKWFPQQDILAHPNVKLFVTHGGLLSITEAVYYGIPIVSIPFYSDQMYNTKRAIEHGYATMIKFEELTEDTLTDVIMEIINNSSYKENALQRSKMFRDRPVKPLDTTIYWVEYVLKHRGAPHLQTAAIKLDWYQYYLLDVIAVLLIILASTLYTIKTVYVLTLRLVFRQT